MINITLGAPKKTSNEVRAMVAVYNNATFNLNKYDFHEFLLACKGIKAKVCDMNIAIHVICTGVQYALDRTRFNIAIYLMTTLWPGDAPWWTKSLQWRHNDRDSISNHRRPDCFLNRLFRHRSKKTSKLILTCLYEGNPPATGRFPSQRTNNTKNVSIWWRHHDWSQHWFG